MYFFITNPTVTLKLSPSEYVNFVQRKTIWTGFLCVCVYFSFCFSFLIDYTINQFICKGYKHRINFISTFANVAVNILGTLLQKKGKITIWQRSPQEAVKVLVLFLRNVYGVIPSHRQIIIADKNIHQVNKHKRRQEQTPSSYMYISVYMCVFI